MKYGDTFGDHGGVILFLTLWEKEPDLWTVNDSGLYFTAFLVSPLSSNDIPFHSQSICLKCTPGPPTITISLLKSLWPIKLVQKKSRTISINSMNGLGWKSESFPRSNVKQFYYMVFWYQWSLLRKMCFFSFPLGLWCSPWFSRKLWSWNVRASNISKLCLLVSIITLSL